MWIINVWSYDVTLYMSYIHRTSYGFNLVLYCILCICVHYLSCWMLVVWMLYVNKIYIIFRPTHIMCYCVFFNIIKIIYYAAINAILIASVLYTVCHLWQPFLLTRWPQCWPTGQSDKMAILIMSPSLLLSFFLSTVAIIIVGFDTVICILWCL